MFFGRASVQRPILLLVLVSVLLITLNYTKIPIKYTNVQSVVRNASSIEEPLVDKSAPLSDEDLLKEVEDSAPNLPVSFWKKHRYSGLRISGNCAIFPHILDLQFNNIYWQTLDTSNGRFQLLNAYLDDRKANKLGPTVRVLAMINRTFPNVTTYCQIWYDDKQFPIITKTEPYRYVWRKEWMQYSVGDYEPYLISCNVPKTITNSTPQAVSLVEKKCDTASNLLKIIYTKTEVKRDFAVCVKGLEYPNLDLSVRLVEWMELLNLLGASTVYFYEFSVHPNVSKVLDYYQMRGKAQVSPFQLAGGQPNLPTLRNYYFKERLQRKRVNEIVPYNDCFYQHMYEYKYIALLDIDEVIVPSNEKTWQELMTQIKDDTNEDHSSYSAQNLYFLDSLRHHHDWFLDIPKYMHMLQHVYRSVNFTRGEYAKSFFNTEHVLTLHNHYPLACLDACRTYDIPLQYAQLNHYRNDCVNELQNKCLSIKTNSVMDTNVWKYKEILIEKVRETLRQLEFF